MTHMNKRAAELDAALERDDFEWIAARAPGHFTTEQVEMSFHKLRIECVNVSIEKRRQSLKWLRDRGLKTMSGGPLPVEIWPV